MITTRSGNGSLKWTWFLGCFVIFNYLNTIHATKHATNYYNSINSETNKQKTLHNQTEATVTASSATGTEKRKKNELHSRNGIGLQGK